MQGTDVDAFTVASRYFVQVVRMVPDDAWDQAALGEWSVMELVGHTNRAHLTIREYLNDPQPPQPPGGTYFSDENIARRGREAVTALGNDPAASVDKDSLATIALVEETPADATIGSPVRTMTLEAYLPSRTAELTIHSLDLLGALGVELAPPAPALTASLNFVTDVAARKGHGDEVLRALTGRAPLPTDFSVY